MICFSNQNTNKKYLRSNYKFDIINEAKEKLDHSTYDCLTTKGEILIWKEYEIPEIHLKSRNVLDRKIRALKTKLKNFYKNKNSEKYFPSKYIDIFIKNDKLIVIRKKLEEFNNIPIFYGSKYLIIKQILDRIYILNYYKFFEINLKIKNFIWNEEILFINDFINFSELFKDSQLEKYFPSNNIKKQYKNVISIIKRFITQFQNIDSNKEDILLLKDLAHKINEEMNKEYPIDLRQFSETIKNYNLPIVAKNLLLY